MKRWLEVYYKYLIQSNFLGLSCKRSFLLTHQHVVRPAGQTWRVHGTFALGACI